MTQIEDRTCTTFDSPITRDGLFISRWFVSCSSLPSFFFSQKVPSPLLLAMIQIVTNKIELCGQKGHCAHFSPLVNHQMSEVWFPSRAEFAYSFNFHGPKNFLPITTASSSNGTVVYHTMPSRGISSRGGELLSITEIIETCQRGKWEESRSMK